MIEEILNYANIGYWVIMSVVFVCIFELVNLVPTFSLLTPRDTTYTPRSQYAEMVTAALSQPVRGRATRR
eukprot:EC713422.1.p1 GENE.EC713422.1~~EC713422.1.p1  ORF type:complete len:70 (+),score=9.70 EC713422.1:59-268(+)